MTGCKRESLALFRISEFLLVLRDTTKQTMLLQSAVDGIDGNLELKLALDAARCGELDFLRLSDDGCILLRSGLTLATAAREIIHVAMLLVVFNPVAHRSNVTTNLLCDGCIVALHLVQQSDGPSSLHGQVAVSGSVALEERWRR